MNLNKQQKNLLRLSIELELRKNLVDCDYEKIAFDIIENIDIQYGCKAVVKSNEKEIYKIKNLLKLINKIYYENLMTASDIKMIIETKLYPQKINKHTLVKCLHRIFGNPKLRRNESGIMGRYYTINLEKL